MPQKPSDRWIPWYFVIFFTALVLVLVPMCVMAFRGYSGTVTDNAYEKGLAYNKDIQASVQQNALGWKSGLSISGKSGRVHADFSLRDAKGKPISDALVKISFIRPVQSGLDQSAELKPQADGKYGADLKLPMDGVWDAYISAMAQGQDYQTKKRIVVP